MDLKKKSIEIMLIIRLKSGIIVYRNNIKL